MVDAIISPLLEQLISIAVEEARQQVRLVVGVDQEVKKLKSNFRAIQAVLFDAEKRQVTEETVRLWVDQLKYTSYDMEDVLDEWITARLKMKIEGDDEKALVPHKKVCSFLPASCFGVKQVFLRLDIALKIKEINEKLDDIAKQKAMFNFKVNLNVPKSVETPGRVQSISLIDESEICGRAYEKNKLISRLLSESSDEQKNIQIISIVGLGGIGKTTLAQIAYNDKDVKDHFDQRMWVCVSDPFDEFRIAKTIIEGLEGETPNLIAFESLVQRIDQSIAGKKFLLVLDDVWTDDRSKWEPFQRCLMNGLRGSRILVTTRKETVARMMESTHVISIEEMSHEECWLLFKRLAFFDRSPLECKNLEEIGRGIVGKCKGLPLAAKTIGSFLRFKKSREYWQSVLDSELWKLEEFEKGLLPPLLLSYNDLPSRLKCCFAYCAVFPKDWDIEKDDLVRLWIAQGYIRPEENKEMELIGGEYFDYLAAISFFQVAATDDWGNITMCRMHDIVHDFAQYLSRDECFSKQVDGHDEYLTNINGEKLRHSMLVFRNNASFPVFILNAKKLRSLLINVSYDVNSPIFNVGELISLRALTICGGWRWRVPLKFCEIPKGIENLIHLRYIKLYMFKIEELPETFCELLNLQILDMEHCRGLKRLPQGIGKLVNLRRFPILSALEYMPKGIERLTYLQSLGGQVVGPSGGKYGNKAFSIEGLRHLNHLQGDLSIKGLGNSGVVDEVKKAELDKKTKIVDLSLDFNKVEEEEQEEEEEAAAAAADHQSIIEALKPPPNLEHLWIHRFAGKFPFSNWILSLTKLKSLRLCCKKWEIMPPLGKLPSLETLEIESLDSVKRVGDEFLGIQTADGSASSSSASVVIAFPKLKHLIFRGMNQWEEWDDIGSGKEDITSMPQLNSLEMTGCGKLKSLPDQLLQSRILVSLNITRCGILKERYNKETGEDWSKISHIEEIRIDGVLQLPTSLEF